MKALQRRISALAFALLPSLASAHVVAQGVPEFWRDGAMATANTAYLYVRATGVEVAYEAFVSRFADTFRQPMNFNELRHTVAASGAISELVELKLEQLVALNRPAIVFVDGWSGSSTAGGAFLLVYGFDEDGSRVKVFSGETALPVDVPTDEFVRIWRGVAMIPQGPRGVFGWALTGAAIGAVLAAAALHVRQRRSRHAGVHGPA